MKGIYSGMQNPPPLKKGTTRWIMINDHVTKKKHSVFASNWYRYLQMYQPISGSLIIPIHCPRLSFGVKSISNPITIVWKINHQQPVLISLASQAGSSNVIFVCPSFRFGSNVHTVRLSNQPTGQPLVKNAEWGPR